MAPQVDLVIVVGSPNSSNSNRLREVAEKIWNEAYMVDDATQIDLAWFGRKNTHRRDCWRIGTGSFGAVGD